MRRRMALATLATVNRYTDTQRSDCPYCGELIELVVDHSMADQQYIEDCEVCCRPISIHVVIGVDQVNIQTERSD